MRKLKNMLEILDLSLLKDECVQGKLWKVWRWEWSEDQELNVGMLPLRYPLDIFTVLLGRWPHKSRFQDIQDTLLKCVYLQISKDCIEIRHFKGKGWGSKKRMQPLGGQTVLPWIPTDRSVFKKPNMTKYIKSCQYTRWERTEQGYEMLSYRDYWWTWKNSHQEWW